MNPLDRINQLNAEVATLRSEKQSMETAALRLADDYDALKAKYCELEDRNAILCTRLRDGQEQAKRDSETIALLAKEKQAHADRLAITANEIRAHLSRHA